jgi:regulator of sigma E protease
MIFDFTALAAPLRESLIGWSGIILMFSVAVAIHELGHLLWAKSFGVGCEEFAIGFGKRLVWREWGGTIYSIRMLPLGGFVKIKGMIAALEEEEQERKEKEASEVEEDAPRESFVRSAVFESSLAMKDLALWKRLLVFSGGVINNMILAFFLYAAGAHFIGLPPLREIPAEIGWVAEESSAAKAGFQRGDRVLAVDGEPVEDFTAFVRRSERAEGSALVTVNRGEETLDITWENPPENDAEFLEAILSPDPAQILIVIPNGPAERADLRRRDIIRMAGGVEIEHWMDLQPVLAAADGGAVDLLVERGDETFTVSVVPEFKEHVGKGRWTIGFYPGEPEGEPVPMSLAESLAWGLDRTLFVSAAILDFLWKAVTLQLSRGEVSDNVGGPVQIFVMAYGAANESLLEFLLFAAYLNIILGIMNILPIPILDGGHCLINIIESARRRPISLRVLERVYTVFFALLVTLMIVLVTKDVFSNLWRITG